MKWIPFGGERVLAESSETPRMEEGDCKLVSREKVRGPAEMRAGSVVYFRTSR